MAEIAINVPIGLGDLIYLKAMLDPVKHKYDKIKIKFHREIVGFYNINSEYNKFLDDIGALFFSEKPYELTNEPGIPFYGMVSVCNDNGITPIKPHLPHLLCKGTPVDVGGDYLVINTKVRYLDRQELDKIIMTFWTQLNRLSQRYRIVILGEREVELHRGYEELGSQHVYSIYNSIRENIPADRLVDLSIPALGKTAPSLQQIQQDCLTMSRAAFVVTLGIGGGFCMATAVANTIGYRTDNDPIADRVFAREYSNAIVTKDWGYFINQLWSRL